ncbi:MAG: hypothetical protein ABW214_01115 [Terrimicrobiaceae bacterium]
MSFVTLYFFELPILADGYSPLRLGALAPCPVSCTQQEASAENARPRLAFA